MSKTAKIRDIQPSHPETVSLESLIATLPEHIKLTIQTLVASSSPTPAAAKTR